MNQEPLPRSDEPSGSPLPGALVRPPTPKDEATRLRMSAQRSSDTAPEVALRKELHALGMRFRKHRSVFSNRRKHDIVLGPSKTVVEVRGCFWHGCPDHSRPTKNNSEWWAAKIAGNRARDEDTGIRLREAGWELVVVWEHEDPAEAAVRVKKVVESRLPDTGRDRGRTGPMRG